MKRNLLFLFALFCAAFIIMCILVKGAEPDRIFTGFNRDYSHYTLQPLDTVQFPGRVSVMRVLQQEIYGYVYSKNIVYRYDYPVGKMDTFYHATDMITRIDADTATHTFYMADGTGRKLYRYQPLNGELDSSGTAGFPLLTKDYDPVKQQAVLKLAGSEKTLYNFQHFEDGGLSADGFFVRNGAHHFYIPFYNGAMLRYDEASGKISMIPTIDKTPAANIAVPTGNIYMLSSKAIIVNSTATADEKDLYVLSYVLSADAVADGYRGPAVDVYDNVSGKYKGSFRLPGFHGKPVLQLGKWDDTLVAAYENNILLFKLNQL